MAVFIQAGEGFNPIEEHMNPERFLKLAEVQRMLGVSRSTVWRWQAERGLRVVTVGGVVRIRESDLNKFLNRHEAGEAGDKPV